MIQNDGDPWTPVDARPADDPAVGVVIPLAVQPDLQAQEVHSGEVTAQLNLDGGATGEPTEEKAAEDEKANETTQEETKPASQEDELAAALAALDAKKGSKK